MHIHPSVSEVKDQVTGRSVAKDFPDLDFWLKYEDDGAHFMGIAKVKKGKVDDQWLDTT